MNVALHGGGALIVRLAVTDRRLMMFATSHLALNLNLGDLLRSVPFSEVDSVESSTFRPLGIGAVRLRVGLMDKSELRFEASGLTARNSKKLVPILKEAVASYHDAARR
jgi:hypothetical protein